MRAIRCPTCGSAEPPQTVSPGVLRCAFCGTSFRDEPQVAMPPKVVVARSSGAGALPFVVVGGLLLAGIGLGAMLVLRAAPPRVSAVESRPPVATAEPAEPKAGKKAKASAKSDAPKDESRPRWASDRVYPIGADVDGDGVEDLVGPTVKQDGPNAQLWVSAFDGKDFHARWSVGPFGAPTGDIEMKMPVVVAGKRFVVLDPKGDAHLYELESGKLVADFPFREEHRGMCGPPANEPKVLIRVGDGDFLVDTEKAVGRAGSPPAWCANNRYFRRRPSESFNSYYGTQAESLQFEALDAMKPPPKTSLRLALADGPLVVGVGVPKGSEEPMLLGFDDKGTLKYQVAGSAIGLTADEHGKDLAFGRFVFLRDRIALVAVDAKCGEKLWETPFEGKDYPNRMSLTSTRVWVTRHDGKSARVEAFDATTGKQLGTAAD